MKHKYDKIWFLNTHNAVADKENVLQDGVEMEWPTQNGEKVKFTGPIKVVNSEYSGTSEELMEISAKNLAYILAKAELSFFDPKNENTENLHSRARELQGLPKL